MDEPLRWLLADSRAFTVTGMGDWLWVRLLDVPRALAGRTYSTAGDVVLEVTDTFPTPSTVRFALRAGEVGSRNADCTATTGPADLALEADGLAAAYLGGVSFVALAAAGRVRELRTGAVERASRMFSTSTAPYCVTMF
jgi:predicted acetyltransferase